jgi:hypothetical protein
MDVYFNTKRDLLVVKKEFPMPPIAAQGKWRKSRKRVIKVSSIGSSNSRSQPEERSDISSPREHPTGGEG